MSLKKPVRKSAPEPEDAPKKGASKSFADAFNSIPAGGGSFMPPGKWKANITGFELVENEKGTSACVEYTGHEDEDEKVAGKRLKQYYKLVEADEKTPGQGCGFFKADMAQLGYEDIGFDDIEAAFKEISREQPLVEIQVKQNGQYTNAYLKGVVSA